MSPRQRVIERFERCAEEDRKFAKRKPEVLRDPVDFSAESAQVLIVHEYLSAIGREGGRSTSKAKVRAARENGKLGGRPRK